LGDRAAPPIDIRDKHPECSLTEPGTNEVRFTKPRTGRVHARNLRPAQAIVYGFPQRQAVGIARIVGLELYNVGRPTRRHGNPVVLIEKERLRQDPATNLEIASIIWVRATIAGDADPHFLRRWLP